MVKSAITHKIKDLMWKNKQNIKPNGNIAYTETKIKELIAMLDVLNHDNEDTMKFYVGWFNEQSLDRKLQREALQHDLSDALSDIKWIQMNEHGFDGFHYQILLNEYTTVTDDLVGKIKEFDKSIMNQVQFVTWMTDLCNKKLVELKSELNYMQCLANSFNSPRFQQTIKLLKLT